MSKPPPLTLQSRVQFHDLIVRREAGKDPLLGCAEIRHFMEVDEDTLYALDVIRRTGTLAEAEAEILRERGEEWDLIDLVSALGNRGFVREFDGYTIRMGQAGRERHPWLHSIPPERLQWLRHPLFLAALGVVFLAWIGTMIIDPAIVPKFTHLFPFQRLSLVIIFAFFGFLATAYIHELAHFFVARSYGIEATINVSHRFSMIVLQTDVTNAWGLPPPARIAIFMAGIVFNVTVAGICGLLVFFAHLSVLDLSATTVNALKFVAALNIIPLFFQLLITARTDLYHVILVLTKERNLSQECVGYLFFTIRRGIRALRGAPKASCASCSGSILEEDPFCPACGELRSGTAAPTWARRTGGRGKLLAWGLVFIAGTFYGLYAVLFMGMKFLWMNLKGAAFFVAAAARHQDYFLVAEGLLALFVLSLQLVFVFVFVRNYLPFVPAPVRAFFARGWDALLSPFRSQRSLRSATLELVAVNGRPTIPGASVSEARRSNFELVAIDGRVVPRRLPPDPSRSPPR